LYIGGDSVGRGYRNLPEQTAHSFLPDPFAAAGGRMYKSGDRATMLPNGEIVFLGRLDIQEKLRCNRLERTKLGRSNRHDDVAFNVVVTSRKGVEST
jgi:non-ribosomal peptide synthetase component F